MTEPRPLFGKVVPLGENAVAKVEAELVAAALIPYQEKAAAKIEIDECLKHSCQLAIDRKAKRDGLTVTSVAFTTEPSERHSAFIVYATAYVMSVPPGYDFDPKQWRPPCPSDRP
jgi:hypothetical protein